MRAGFARRKGKSERGGYVYLHSAVDGYSRLAYTEALPDERAVTAIGFMHRARAWFAANGIMRIERIVTDNGACYRAEAFARALLGSRHQRITPYTPRHNGESRALQPDHRRGTPLRPRVELRRRTDGSPRSLEHPLQLSSTTQRGRRPATGITGSGRCHQRPGLLQLDCGQTPRHLQHAGANRCGP